MQKITAKAATPLSSPAASLSPTPLPQPSPSPTPLTVTNPKPSAIPYGKLFIGGGVIVGIGLFAIWSSEEEKKTPANKRGTLRGGNTQPPRQVRGQKKSTKLGKGRSR